jgi:hypothetical protein
MSVVSETRKKQALRSAFGSCFFQLWLWWAFVAGYVFILSVQDASIESRQMIVH